MDKKAEDMLKKLAKDVTDVAQPYLEKAQPYIDDIRSKAEPVVEDVVSKASPVVEDIKSKAVPVAQDLLGKAEPVINVVKEKTGPAAKKATKAAKTVGDGISLRAAKAACKEEIFVQYSQHEVRTSDILDRAKADYVKKGNEITDIKEIQVYIKPSDNAAYYVVNHSETGKIEF